MSYNEKERIAEYHRRAEEYKRLFYAASSFDEREAYILARRDFLLLARDLEKMHAKPKTRLP